MTKKTEAKQTEIELTPTGPTHTTVAAATPDTTPDVVVQPHKRTRPKRARKPKKPAEDARFEAIGTRIGKLVGEKNLAYGDSFAKTGSFLQLLYPNGIQPIQYGDMLAMVRIFDKQMRIATDIDALGESPFDDITGYGILGVANHEHRKKCREAE
jgi:hypothetical protein